MLYLSLYNHGCTANSQTIFCNIQYNQSLIIQYLDANAKKIPIKKVRGDILELIVNYLKHHNGKKPEEIAKPIRSVKMERIVADKWDADYINKMNKKTIFQVILGANYMDLPSLLHLGCAKIATLIKGKSPEEIKNILADDSSDNKQEENKDDQ